MTQAFIDPTNESVMALMRRGIRGPFTMLNLVRLREVADYGEHPELAPAEPISGRQAFDRYIEHTLPFLEASGGELLYLGRGGAYLVGPAGEGWDLVMLVRQTSIESFLSFAGNQEYLAGLGHRVAAITDSRILPMSDQAIA